MRATMTMAGTFSTAPVDSVQPSVNERATRSTAPRPARTAWVYGADVYCAGMTMPRSLRNETT